MKISSFLKISWFGVRICNFESKFSFFFHLQLHFFSFSFVFDGFPLFFIDFHGFPGFQVPRARKMKKMKFKMKKMKFEMKKMMFEMKKMKFGETKNEKKEKQIEK